MESRLNYFLKRHLPNAPNAPETQTAMTSMLHALLHASTARCPLRSKRWVPGHANIFRRVCDARCTPRPARRSKPRCTQAVPLTRDLQTPAGLSQQPDAEVAISTVLGSYVGRDSGQSEWCITGKWIRHDDFIRNQIHFVAPFGPTNVRCW
jgi:hypothetical protein